MKLSREAFFDILDFAPHPAQAAVIADPHKHQLLRCGRRWGKSLFGAVARVAPALFRAERGWWIAPSMTVAHEGLMYARKFAEKLEKKGLIRRPAGEKLFRASPVPRLQTEAGGIFEFRTTGIDPRRANLVGSGLHRLILDECARIPHLVWLVDEQLAPTLLDFQGSMTLFSTPRGKRTGFAEMEQRAGRQSDLWGVHHYSTFDNPNLAREAIAELEVSGTPQLMRQELYAEEIEDFGAFFPHVPRLKPLTPILWQGWGWDYAMGGTAAFVKVVEDAAHRLIAVEEKCGPFTWEAQVKIAQQIKATGLDLIVDCHLEDTFKADLLRHKVSALPSTQDRRGSLELLRTWLNTDIAGLAEGDTCSYLAGELADAEIDERDCEDMAKESKDHAIDAFRYAFLRRWPRAKEYHKPPTLPAASLAAMIQRMDRAEKIRR